MLPSINTKPHGAVKPRLINLKLHKRRKEAEGIFSFYFDRPSDYTWVPGQFTHLVAEAPQNEFDRSLVRHMSIASVPEEDHVLFTMDLRSQTPYKTKFAALEPGDSVSVFGTHGEFVLRDTEAELPLVFIAGGIGITPIRSLSKVLHSQGQLSRAKLIHAARKHYSFQKELSAWGLASLWTNREGILFAVEAALADSPEAVFYLSGSGSFVNDLSAFLLTKGLPQERLRVENFTH